MKKYDLWKVSENEKLKYNIKHINNIILFVILLSTLFSASFVDISFAASGIDILDRQRDNVRPDPLSKPKIHIEDEKKAAVEDSGMQCVLASLQVSGATVFSEEELLAPYRKLFGTRVDLAEVYGIAAELTRKYREAGYLLSRVIVPEQEVEQSGAVIRLLAVEGYVESVVYTGDERILSRFKRYFAPVEERLVGSRPLKHSAFERSMLLMQDVPGINLSSRFKKGNHSGASVLVLDVQGDMVEGSLGWGNTGTASSGPGIFSAGLSFNTLPVIGAQTSLSYAQADNYREYWSTQVTQSYRMWNGLSFKASYAYSDSPDMDTDFARLFDYTTKSHTLNLGMSYPVIRSRDMNLSLGVNYEHRNSNADVLEERFSKDRLRTLSVNANMDFSDELGGVTQIIPTLYRGMDVFGATDESSIASNSLAPAEFWKFGLYVSRNQALPRNFSLFTAAQGQVSSASLASYNKFSFGGSSFGRGYEPGIIEGDSGVALLLEPRWTYYFADSTALQLFAFFDWGRVWERESPWGAPDSDEGSSVGAGVRFQGHAGPDILPDFQITAFVGQPLERAGDDKGNTPRFVVQLGFFF